MLLLVWPSKTCLYPVLVCTGWLKGEGSRTWHQQRSGAWLGSHLPYSEALCCASRAFDEVAKLSELLKFEDTLGLVMWNHGQKRSFAAVLRRQLTPAAWRGVIFLDAKADYFYGLLAGADVCMTTPLLYYPPTVLLCTHCACRCRGLAQHPCHRPRKPVGTPPAGQGDGWHP